MNNQVQPTDKPVVHYAIHHANHVHKGESALIQPIDHPSGYVTNTAWAVTSTVVAHDGDDFETLNTKYVGVK